MRRVSADQGHLSLATFVRISNVWLLTTGEGQRFLVDTGHFLERPVLLASLWRAGIRRAGDLAAVLLTHRHSDHAGNAAWLRERFRCPVVCHEADALALSGKATPPRLMRWRSWLNPLSVHEAVLCRFEDRLPARCEIDETFGHGAWRHGFSVAHVPGHTEGSVMLHHEPTRTLFSGDAILAGLPPLRCVEWLRLAVPGFSLDVDTCRDHVRRYLGQLPPTEALCSGHGPPVLLNAREKLARLATV